VAGFSYGAAIEELASLKGEVGELLPWQKRNFRPLPQGHGR